MKNINEMGEIMKENSPSRTEIVPVAITEIETKTRINENIINKIETPGFHVVGIGASAGGLEAFKRFFTALPPDCGASFVLIPHLDPNHNSLMVELLARQTKMRVIEATEGLEIQPNHVYILPPNSYMTISAGKLNLTQPIQRSGPPTSIDLFLRSLATDKQEKAICIILSGTGSHGTLGLKEIKAMGGMAMVQDPGTAEYSRMPQSAIATGLADYVLPPEMLPDALIKYLTHHDVNKPQPASPATDSPDNLDQILKLLRSQMRFDFRCYRKPMVNRRIERRMSLGCFNKIADYLVFLRENPGEVKLLYRDLLISVTNFFRDSPAFQALEAEVIAPLIQSRDSDSPLRLWSAGCATGEEAYSLGIAVIEMMALAQKNNPIQIFATDVDESALDIARLGYYPESIATDVKPERLRAFFTSGGDTGFRVSKDLRDIVTFARQNLVTDPPFSKLDLIVCRNVLIYLEPEIQAKVISLLHYSLKEGGFLFLGPSETLGPNIDLFEPVSKKWRIFRRIGPGRPDRIKVPVAATIDSLMPARRSSRAGTIRPFSLSDLTHRLLLDQFAPPAVLINRKYEILYFFGRTDQYLAHPDGEPTQDLMKMTGEGLRAKLRSAIHKALRQKYPVTIQDQPLKRFGQDRLVVVTIQPIQGNKEAEGLLLVTFKDSDQEIVFPRTTISPAEESLVQHLEIELKATKEDLQDTIEELEGSNEELKVTNEEAMSINEELQSANEELETSKEELQSLNEEMATVNSQLEEKVADLETANNDLANLLNCTEVAIVFLDNQLKIQRFTPPAKRLFNLIPSDHGRPIGDITPRFPESTLQSDVELVLKTQTPQEKQVRTMDGCWWNQRITLYRTLDNRVEGSILTFTDLTQFRLADEQARRLGAVLFDSNDAVMVHDFEGKITAWNRGAEKMFGYNEQEALQMNVEQMTPEEFQARSRAFWERLRRGERVDSWETQRLAKNGSILDVWVTGTFLKDELGQPIAVAKTERDITEQKRVQFALRKSREQLGAVLQTAADAIITTNIKGIIMSVNAATERMFGYTSVELIGQNVKMLMPSPEREAHDSYLENFARSGVKKIIGIGREVVARRKDGSSISVDLAVSEVDHLQLFTGILRDITQRKQGEAALRESERFARSTLDGLSAHIAIVDEDGNILAVNNAWKAFAANHCSLPGIVEEGTNYLSVCEQNQGPFLDEGKAVAKGIRAVLAKEIPEFVIEYPSDAPDEKRWFIMRVTPFPHDGLRRVVIAHEDITRRKELEREVVEISSLEQRRIGQDLHDSVGQELSALNILAVDLADAMKVDSTTGLNLVQRLITSLKRSQKELRSVMRGLLPVAVDAEGLMAALSDLADRIQGEGKLDCTFYCPDPVSVVDNLTATHIYLIAQEAVHNAVKHAHAKNILISLVLNHLLTLCVKDDGIGILPLPLGNQSHLGLRIMRNRAAIIGATLAITRAKPSGTQVTCTLGRKEYEPKSGS